ncbi:LysR substrate-binding domain-containing protein [Pararhizobium mangrovi]|uniref:LysR substrate-binding domain-containing protein n=1 Tax=Pararhizobium mangrovi TaxID=2590452 RepID=UPI0015E83665|nr:LysR substrate-binding domain-containing protein [Pararhizobium mangrovi]
MPSLPSIKALRALEAVARLGSVRHAAEELLLTSSAVSHQLRFLEDELGIALVEKKQRGIALTAEGERYAGEIRSAFRILTRARESVSGPDLSGPLTISCSPGFATYWLCPNIASFIAAHPRVKLKIAMPRVLGEVTQSNVDIFIAYGQGDWPDMWIERIADLQFSPVCSPMLLQKGLRKPRDLARFPLLHIEGQKDWPRWLASAKVTGIAARTGIEFADVNLAMAAAIAGQGVVIGDNLIASTALAKGTLVRPFPTSIAAQGAYYVVAPHAFDDDPICAAFVEWLRAGLSAHGIAIDADASLVW